MSTVVQKESVSEKAFIEPGLTEKTRTILKDTKIDEFLYGQQLGDKIMKAKAINKLEEKLKVQATNANTHTSKKQLLN